MISQGFWISSTSIQKPRGTGNGQYSLSNDCHFDSILYRKEGLDAVSLPPRGLWPLARGSHKAGKSPSKPPHPQSLLLAAMVLAGCRREEPWLQVEDLPTHSHSSYRKQGVWSKVPPSSSFSNNGDKLRSLFLASRGGRAWSCLYWIFSITREYRPPSCYSV